MKRLLLSLFTIALMVSGCIGPFYESDLGKNIKLPVGTPFEVRLEGNPGTEFAWKVNELDTNVVRMVLRPVFKPNMDKEAPGGIYSFYFQTVGEGKTQLEMIYASKSNQSEDQGVIKKFSMEVESKI